MSPALDLQGLSYLFPPFPLPERGDTPVISGVVPNLVGK